MVRSGSVVSANVGYGTAEEDMTAADVQVPENAELERIERWRSEELQRAGYSPEDAAELAARHYVDLHLAVDLVEQGCPPDLAVRILL
jgi:hypothetical protein